MRTVHVLHRLDWWIVLLAMTVAVCGCAFVHSATLEDASFSGLHLKQMLLLAIAVGSGGVIVLIPYLRVGQWTWVLYGLGIAALLGLSVLGTTINGAQRWYRLPGFTLQPSEFAKLATILALASYLRFRSSMRTLDGLIVPLCITAVPALLVWRQPDLGSALVFGPVMLAMCYAAGAPARGLLTLVALGVVLAGAGYFVLHDYQRDRVDAWLAHFQWGEGAEREADVRAMLRDAGYQPWQALIAIGSGGLDGFGLGSGPQNRYGFLPYRFDDYIFAVVAEETGWLGAAFVLLLQGALIAGLFAIALRTRERFGRLLAIGVAAYFATQTLIHAAVCTWLIPATGLPMPLVSYGGSSTVVSVWGIALVLNAGARREPVLASDGFA
jgi:rod shape determining protein RodA